MSGVTKNIQAQFGELNGKLAGMVKRVYYSDGDFITSLDFSPYPFGVYYLITYRSSYIIWRWGSTLRYKVIEKEGDDEIPSSDGLVFSFGRTRNYVILLALTAG